MSKNPDLAQAEEVRSARDRQEQIEKDRYDLLHSVSAGKLDTLQECVALILNHTPDARDSDITLQLGTGKHFEGIFFPVILYTRRVFIS